MGKMISIGLFVLVAEAYQFYLYTFLAAHDLARIGLLGPLAGALVGVAVASLFELLWRKLPRFTRCVIYVSIVALFISAGTTYYQSYAEQITYDARLLHPQAALEPGHWSGEPWMMYPTLGKDGLGTGCQYLWTDVLASVVATLATAFVWFPFVALIAWLTTRPRTRTAGLEPNGVVAA